MILSPRTIRLGRLILAKSSTNGEQMTFYQNGKSERSRMHGGFRWSDVRECQSIGVRMAILLGLLVFNAACMPLAAQDTMPIPLNVMRYARHLLEKYDVNGDGLLQPEEWKEMRGDPAAADANGDGQIDVHELARYIADYGAVRRIRLMPSSSESLDRLPSLLYDAVVAGDAVAADPQIISKPEDIPANQDMMTTEAAGEKQFTVKPSRLPPGLPPWFHKLDADGDGQITLSEFAPTASVAALREFEAYDHNRDGVITPQEAAAGPKYPSPEGEKK